MSWTLIYSQFLTRIDGVIPPQIISGVTSPKIAFLATSETARITWRRAFRASMLIPSPTGSEDLVVFSRRVPLSQNFQVVFPDFAPLASYSLRLEVPPWHSEMNIQVWQSTEEIEPPDSGQQFAEEREFFVVSSTGQTQFQLSKTVVRPEISELFINGVKATYSTEYLVDGAMLTWLNTPELDFTDEVEFLYFS